MRSAAVACILATMAIRFGYGFSYSKSYSGVLDIHSYRKQLQIKPNPIRNDLKLTSSNSRLIANHNILESKSTLDRSDTFRVLKIDPEQQVRLLMLLFYGSLGSLLPYLPLYYKGLGLEGILHNNQTIIFLFNAACMLSY